MLVYVQINTFFKLCRGVPFNMKVQHVHHRDIDKENRWFILPNCLDQHLDSFGETMLATRNKQEIYEEMPQIWSNKIHGKREEGQRVRLCSRCEMIPVSKKTRWYP